MKMKKSVRFILLLCCVVILFIVVKNFVDRNYKVKIHYGNLENHIETITYKKGESINSNSLAFSEKLSNDYHLDGWYMDSNYKNKFDSLKITSNVDIYAKITKYDTVEKYIFNNDIETSKIIDLFKRNGEYVDLNNSQNSDMIEAFMQQEIGNGNSFYRLKFDYKDSDNYVSEILYFPKTNLIRASLSKNSKSTVDNITWDYKYSGTVEYTLGQKVNEATFYGVYNQSCVDINAGKYKAYYTANIDYSINKINPEQHCLGDFNTCEYSCNIVDAMDYNMAKKHLDKKDVSLQCYEMVNGCFGLLDTIFQKIDASYHTIR